METVVNEMMIKIADKIEIEHFISILNLGLCVAIENGVLSIEEAEAYLYSPYTMEQLEKLGVAQELIDIIHLGTELSDLESLLPEKLSSGIEEIKTNTLELIKSRSALISTTDRKKWIQIQKEYKESLLSSF